MPQYNQAIRHMQILCNICQLILDDWKPNSHTPIMEQTYSVAIQARKVNGKKHPFLWAKKLENILIHML